MKLLKRITLAVVGVLALAGIYGCDNSEPQQKSGSPDMKPQETQPDKTPKNQEREQPKESPKPPSQP